MGAKEIQLAKTRDAQLWAADHTQNTLSGASTELHDASQGLVRVGSDSGLEGLAGNAAMEAFAQLSRECAQLSLDLNTMANIGVMARAAIEDGAARYEALPPVELTSSQRSRVANAYATQEPIYVSGHGMLPAWGAEQAWLADARAKREAEAARALSELNARMMDAAAGARDLAQIDAGEREVPEPTPPSTDGSTTPPAQSGAGTRAGAGTGTGTGSSPGTYTVTGIGGGGIVADPPARDWSDISADGSTTGTGGGRGTGTGGSGIGSGAGSSGGGSWGGPGGIGGSSGTGGAGGVLAGGAAVGGVAAGALGLGRGGLGIGAGGIGLGGAGGASGPIGGAAGRFGAAGVGGAGGAGGSGAAGSGTAGLGAAARGGGTGSTVLGQSAAGAQGSSSSGQASGRGGMGGAPMGGSGAAGAGDSKARRRGAGYLAPDVDIEDETGPVALGPAGRAGSRDEVIEAPDLDVDDDW